MRSITRIMGFCLLVAPWAGCGGGNPLVGLWNTSYNTSTTMGMARGSLTADIRGDGTAVYTVGLTSVSAAGVQATCTGTLTYTGLMWSSTATVLTVSGPGTCTGSSTCTLGPISYTFDCSMAMGRNDTNPVGTYNYTLVSNNTLTVTNTNSGSSAVTFTRVN
jgi:hypothetical protein